MIENDLSSNFQYLRQEKKILYQPTEDEFEAAGAGWLSGLDTWLFSTNGEFSSLGLLLFDLSGAFITAKTGKIQ